MGTPELLYPPRTISQVAVSGFCDANGLLITPGAYDTKFSLLDGTGTLQVAETAALTGANYTAPGSFNYAPVAAAFLLGGNLLAQFRAYNLGGSTEQARVDCALRPIAIPTGTYRRGSINRVLATLLGPNGAALSSPVVNVKVADEYGVTVLLAFIAMTSIGSNEWQYDVPAVDWTLPKARVTVEQYATGGATLQNTLITTVLDGG